MMLLILMVLLSAAAVCLGLSRRVPTRWLGFLAAGSLLLATTVLVIGRWREIALPVPAPVWMGLEQVQVHVSLHMTGASEVLALVLTGGGALALAALALALSPTVRGFGALFAGALLSVAFALVGLVSQGMLIPFAWSLTVLAAYTTVRGSGSLSQHEGVPWSVALGLLASLLLMGGMVMVASGSEGLPDSPLARGIILIACVMLVGSAPFHHAVDEAVEAPAALGGTLYGLVFPTLALGTLLRLSQLPGLASLPALHPLSLLMLTLGLVGTVAGAAGALREHRMRRVVAWLASWQAGTVVLAAGLGGPLAALAGQALLVNLALTTLVASLAVTVLEHLSGSDDITQEGADRGKLRLPLALRVAGVAWGVAALSALGVLPLWGFWGKLWLLQAIVQQAPWVLPPLLAAGGVAALAYLVPLGRFWAHRPARGTGTESPPQRPGVFALLRCRQSPGECPLLLLLASVPLVVLGIAPHLAFLGEGARLFAEHARTMVGYAALQRGAVVLAGVGLALVLAIWRAGWTRRSVSDPDMTPVVLTPHALAREVRPLAGVGRPVWFLHGIWRGCLLLNKGVHMGLALFEHRYYLTGVVLVLISLVVLMVQL
jgi:formate hydrogenlyase subunit 3/multisubunit Na+/H+ antiporter MnhD subunit